MIRLSNVSKIYFEKTENELAAVSDLSLQIEKGELVAIIGQSGSGKSTLMNIIGALDKPTRGGYILDGIPVHEMDDNRLSDVRSRKIGFVFQSFNLLSRINSVKNVELPMMYAGVPAGKRHKRALKLLEKVGMSDRADHRPNELSGGQKQRVAIARALSNEPSIILADEPTGALDSKTSEMVMNMFLDIHKNEGTTVVIITHSQEVADSCDRIVKMIDGKIVSDGKKG
jgi:putative ABC transport system ATP-binding protein